MSSPADRSFASFALLVVVLHTATYFVAGVLSFALLDYGALWSEPELAAYSRPLDSPLVQMGVLFQPARGLLFAAVLWPLRRTLAEQRVPWAYLWALFVVLGILGPFVGAPGSIEGLVYSALPITTHLRLLPEVLLQTLALSLLLWRYDLAPVMGRPSLSSRVEPRLALALGLAGVVAMMVSGAIAAASVGISSEALSRSPGATGSAIALTIGHLVLAVPLASLARGARHGSAALVIAGFELAVPLAARLAAGPSPVPLALTLATALASAALLWAVYRWMTRPRAVDAPATALAPELTKA